VELLTFILIIFFCEGIREDIDDSGIILLHEF